MDRGFARVDEGDVGAAEAVSGSDGIYDVDRYCRFCQGLTRGCDQSPPAFAVGDDEVGVVLGGQYRPPFGWDAEAVLPQTASDDDVVGKGKCVQCGVDVVAAVEVDGEADVAGERGWEHRCAVAVEEHASTVDRELVEDRA